jgi:hypothetical protein
MPVRKVLNMVKTWGGVECISSVSGQSIAKRETSPALYTVKKIESLRI